jgi:hypothetical protein
VPELKKVILSDQVKEQMDKDPEIAEFMKEMIANFHQAQDAVDRGQYASMDEALEAITGGKVNEITEEDLLAALDEDDDETEE